MKTVLLFLLLSPAMLWAQLIKIAPQDMQRKQSYVLLHDGSMVRGRIVRQDSSIITVIKRDGDRSFIEADQIVTISATRLDMAVRAGQAPATIFVLKDGSQVVGKFVRRDSTMITVRKKNGQLTYFEPELLVRVDTISLESADFSLATGPKFPNRFSPWLTMGVTAYNPEKGRFYYRNTFLLLNEFDYGITRNWSVGANFITPSSFLSSVNNNTFNGYFQSHSRLFSKFSVQVSNQFRVGLNVLYKDGAVSNTYKRGSLTFQALGSFGTSQQNVTLGYGLVSRGAQHIYQYQSMYYSSVPVYIDVHTPNQSFLTLGIMQKVSPSLTLISDSRVNLGTYNYYYDDNSEQVSLSFALRLDRQRHAFDLGLTGLVYNNNYYSYGKQVRFLPYLGYNLIIGKP
ncbi:hypothetical protein [Spirosoma flavum]|uniref:DUF481 domain-containing protein n=1 Tax=Spirosoma flavum TaxID=2048557 RepID=A0ABW6AHG7_9BACT